MTTQLIDHATLNELREALGDELDSIVKLYVDGLAEQSGALATLLAAGDLATLRRSAHSLKGSSVSMGAQQLGALAGQIEKLASAIQRQLETLGESEIESKRIGEFVMDGLKALDSVAYIRFASVYKDFSEAKDFEDFAGSVVEAAQK